MADLQQREERKRERCWDSRQRWLVIQDTITWAATQATVRQRFTPAARKAEERAKLHAPPIKLEGHHENYPARHHDAD